MSIVAQSTATNIDKADLQLLAAELLNTDAGGRWHRGGADLRDVEMHARNITNAHLTCPQKVSFRKAVDAVKVKYDIDSDLEVIVTTLQHLAG